MIDLKTIERLKVKVKPNARKTEILKWDGEKLHVAIAAPADKNKANGELIRFLSKKTGKKVKITRGLTSKDKSILIS